MALRGNLLQQGTFQLLSIKSREKNPTIDIIKEHTKAHNRWTWSENKTVHSERLDPYVVT